MTAGPNLVNVVTRHQVFLERLKAGQAAKFRPYLRELDKVIRDTLSRQEGVLTRTQVTKVLSDLSKVQKGVYADYFEAMMKDYGDLAEAEAAFEVRALQASTRAASISQATRVVAAVKQAPMSVRGSGGGKLLEPFIKDWSASEIERVNNLVRRGASEGRTVSQLVREIRGTAANKFKDGELALIDRHNRTVVRTSLQHVSSRARQKVWEDNSDIISGVEWTSTLDSGTTDQCKGLDGEIFPIDEGPRPPIHPGCRSTTVPVLKPEFEEPTKRGTRAALGAEGGGPVSAEKTYYSWLKDQPADFQDAAVGPVRGKLLRNGGLTTEQFRKLQLNREFEPLTLKQMQKLEPLAFEQANIKV